MPREEVVIFTELAKLCSQPGYIHVLANICTFENTIPYSDKLTPKDILSQYSPLRLIRTEISTLIGLMIKKDITTSMPKEDEIGKMFETTYSLLEELHHALALPMFNNMKNALSSGNENYHPCTDGNALREAIFYGSESAYSFQYVDLAVSKFKQDDAWLLKNKGFLITDAQSIVNSIADIFQEKIKQRAAELRSIELNKRTFLPAYIFSAEEIANKTKFDINIVKNVLEAFSPPSNIKYNQEFQSVNDFNVSNAYPLIRLNENEYLLLQYSSLAEALCETPFYWMVKDKKYLETAMKNRGNFTENFTAQRLKIVFGNNRVFKNVLIFDSHLTKKEVGRELAEIDVLVLFGDRALIIQTKSKRLTLKAKKGNGGLLQDDFKKGIQTSYDQALSCSKFITSNNYSFIEKETNQEIKIPSKLTEVYPVSIISNHYPALSAQSRGFLKYTKTDVINPPFVMDIFLLDVMTEMLQSPLHFLSYTNRRVRYLEKVICPDEHSVLGYHLTRNLWITEDWASFTPEADFSVDIDIAMQVRRLNLPGNPTPKGILTKFQGTHFGNLIQKIQASEDSGIIDLGFMLLTIGERSIVMLNESIQKIINQTKKDGKPHDVSMAFGKESGLTIHCNNEPYPFALARLTEHCKRRKYLEQAKTWFGICIDINNNPKTGIKLEFPWQWSEEMAISVKNMKKGGRPENSSSSNNTYKKFKKTGRNDPCPCGSKIKYKKCCLNR